MEASNKHATEEQLESYYKELEQYNVAPLWTVMADIQGREPASKVTPYVWPWKDIRPRAIRASELVGTEQAERDLRRAALCARRRLLS